MEEEEEGWFPLKSIYGLSYFGEDKPNLFITNSEPVLDWDDEDAIRGQFLINRNDTPTFRIDSKNGKYKLVRRTADMPFDVPGEIVHEAVAVDTLDFRVLNYQVVELEEKCKHEKTNNHFKTT